MSEPQRTVYPIDEPCPLCGSDMASDGKREWCMDEDCGWEDESMSRTRYDVIYHGDGAPRIDYHFCRTMNLNDRGELEGCYGTNPDHGYTFQEAKNQLIAWHQGQIDRLVQMTKEQWERES